MLAHVLGCNSREAYTALILASVAWPPPHLPVLFHLSLASPLPCGPVLLNFT